MRPLTKCIRLLASDSRIVSFARLLIPALSGFPVQDYYYWRRKFRVGSEQRTRRCREIYIPARTTRDYTTTRIYDFSYIRTTIALVMCHQGLPAGAVVSRLAPHPLVARLATGCASVGYIKQ